MIGTINTAAGDIPQVSASLGFNDWFGAVGMRFGILRDNYKIDPGMYAVGNPDKDSVVFVTANYKLTFDSLRKELGGLNAWLLVLDTKGINVWCAAGKGTFGTLELLNRINAVNLEKIVSHKQLILPQLGAVGVAAQTIKLFSGFSVIYGPIRAEDIKQFILNGMKAGDEMRKVRFSFYDRLVLVPLEFVGGLKYLLISLLAFFLLAGINKHGYFFQLSISYGIISCKTILIAYITGSVIGPLFLPYLPLRSFSSKGYFAGLIVFFIIYFLYLKQFSPVEITAWFLIIPAVSSFILMNFTGASTYTSLSGVKKEMKTAVPLQLSAVLLGTLLWIINRFI
ncbi:MAG: acetyl-CoA synthase subunit gamma [Elusimicrobia bacterium]|nr:acetyl-CoA synthase subunit gamma [Candidatus Liberimonas magnetica]